MTIHEVLTEASQPKTRQERAEVLKKYNCLALRDILRGAFDDRIEWLLPKKDPTYESGESTDGSDPSNLHLKTKLLGYFVKGGLGDRVKPAKRERMFLEVLESLPADDAKVLLAAKNKKLHHAYPKIDRWLVEAAFPNLINHREPQVKKDATPEQAPEGTEPPVIVEPIRAVVP